MNRKNPVPTIRPAGIQSMSPGLYAQVKRAIRELAVQAAPIRVHA